jgi:hypothetical protein
MVKIARRVTKHTAANVRKWSQAQNKHHSLTVATPRHLRVEPPAAQNREWKER